MPTEDRGREALDLALGLVSRRPLTRTEVRDRLVAAGHDPSEASAAVDRLVASGILDDARLASHYLLTRSERLGHGRERLTAELLRRGVEPEVVEGAFDRAVADGDFDPGTQLAREVERRVAGAGGALDRKRYARVYNALLRAGFDPGAVAAALERYRSDAGD
ncbi:MAG: recombination regulator RecX [Acidobacteriia bacterium]|nr:recombination regulator RecX [Terriglobia bacterium]